MNSSISILSIAISLMIGIFSPAKVSQGFVGTARNGEFARLKPVATIRRQLGRKIDDYLKRAVPFGFSGAVLVAKDDEIILLNGYGLADRERGIPMTADSVLYIGSLTKQFTSAAVLKLEMQEKLRVTDTLDKFFAEVPADKKAITIHQLLTHSSGLGDTEDKYGSFVPIDEQLRRTMRMKLNFEPGKKYLYSNAGYSLLAMIVENVSGESYEKYLHENVFKPAGMFETGYRIPKWEKEKIARGYSDEIDKGSPLERSFWMEDGPSWAVRGAGAMLSTLGDLYRWHLSLKKDEILSVAAKRRTFSPHVTIDDNLFYGYGWLTLKTDRGTNLITHAGSDGIFYADIRRYVDENVVVIGFTNDASNSGLINGKVPSIIFGGGTVKFPPLAGARTIAPAILQKYPGTYRLPSGAGVNVTLKKDRLVLDPIGQEAVNLTTGIQPAQTEKFGKLTSQIKTIFDEAVKGDFTRLKASVTAEKFEGYKVFITDNLQSSGSDERPAYEVLGTHPLWFTDETPPATFVRVNNGKDARQLLIFVWASELLAARLALSESDAVSFRSPFVARSPHSFVGFHKGLEKTVNIKFKMNRKGEATAIEFQTLKGVVTANRVSSLESRTLTEGDLSSIDV